MTKFKKLLSVLLMLGALASCGETPSASQSEQPQQSEQPSEIVDNELDASLVGIAQNKTVYLTTVGQSDTNIVSNVLNRAEASGAYTLQAMLRASEVEEGAVVLLTLGSSSKGLGAAGVDEAHEKARAKEFSDAAKTGKFTLILFHVGGTTRRGTSSDPIIEAAFPGAKACFVVEEGNTDKFFTNLSSSNQVKLYSVEKTIDLVDYAKTLFGKDA